MACDSSPEKELLNSKSQQHEHQQQRGWTSSLSKRESYGSFTEMNENSSRRTSVGDTSFSKVRRVDYDMNISSEMAYCDPLAPEADVSLRGTSLPTTTFDEFDLIHDRALSFLTSNTSATEVSTPALPSSQYSSEYSVIAGSIVNLCSATLGAGVLALPYALYQAGIVIGVLMLLISAIITVYSIDLIVMGCHVYKQYTYEALTEHVLGVRMRQWIEFSILIFSGGCAIAYVIAVGDILDKSHLLIHNSRSITIFIVWLVAMMPLSMFRKMQNLQFASAFGIASIMTLIFAAAIHLFQDVEDVHPNDTVPSADHDEKLILYSCLWPANGFVSVVTALPIIVFAFSCQCNVCAIFEELPDHILSTGPRSVANTDQLQPLDGECITILPTLSISNAATIQPQHAMSTSEVGGLLIDCKKDVLMHKVTTGAVWICAALYTMVSLVSLSDFGIYMTPNMLSSYRPVGVMQIAMTAMALAVVMAFPLNIFPARVTVNGWIEEKYSLPDGQQKANPKELVSTSTCDGRSSFWWCHSVFRESNVMQLYRTEESDTNRVPTSEPQRSLRDGLHLSSSSCTLTVHQGAKEEVSLTTALLEHRNDEVEQTPLLLQHNDEKMNAINNEVDLDFSWTRHILVTLCLTGITLILALILPNISVVFGLLGGTASSFLGFCVPGMIGIQLKKDLFPHPSTNINEIENDFTDTVDPTIPSSNGPLHPPVSGSNNRIVHNTTTIGMFCTKWKLSLISWSLLIGGIVAGTVSTAVTFYSTIASTDTP